MAPTTEPTVASRTTLPFSATYSPPTIQVPFALIASAVASMPLPAAVTVRPSSSPCSLTTTTVFPAVRLLAAIVWSAWTSMS